MLLPKKFPRNPSFLEGRISHFKKACYNFKKPLNQIMINAFKAIDQKKTTVSKTHLNSHISR